MSENIQQTLINFFNERTTNKFIDYNDYIKYQTKNGLSFEKDNVHWTKGQHICIENKFKNIDRNVKILDLCSGDGRGLQKFRDLGFKNVTGVEVSDDKIKFAESFGYKIIKKDICSGPFDFNDKFDIIYSSHTLEHVLNPEYTLKNVMNSLNDDGKMFLILPYPDFDAGKPENDHNFKVHCGVIPLGLHINDNGQTTCNIIKNLGYKIEKVEFHSFREPEIHLTINK